MMDHKLRDDVILLAPEYAKQQAIRDGAKRISIDHWAFNEASKGCFAKSGFTPKYIVFFQEL